MATRLSRFVPRWCWLVVLVAVLASGRPAVGQNELPDDQLAVLAFDINIEKLSKASWLDREMVNEMIREVARDMDLGGGDMLDGAAGHLIRIRGALGAPAGLGELMTLGPGEPLPFNFIVRLEFDDSAVVEEMLQEVQQDSRVLNEAGRVLYAPDDEFAPENLRAGKGSGVSMEFGTARFVAREDYSERDLFATDLRAQWEQLPDHAIRLALDTTRCQEFVADMTDAMRQEAPPEAMAFIGLLEKLASLRLAADLVADEMLIVQASGHNADDGASIHTGLEALIGMARMGMMATGDQIQRESPATGKFLGELLNGIKTTIDGSNVKLIVVKPAGFAEQMEMMLAEVENRGRQVRRMNDLRQIILAIHNYYDAYKQFAFEAGRDSNAGLSWRTRLLPFVESMEMYDQIDREKPWDDAANRQFADQMPVVFSVGTESDSLSPIGWVMPPNKPRGFESITDGMSNTIALVVCRQGTPWMQPGEFTIEMALAEYDALADDEALLVAFYDGSVQRISKSTTPREEFKAKLDPADGR